MIETQECEIHIICGFLSLTAPCLSKPSFSLSRAQFLCTLDMEVQLNLSKSTDHGTTFKWSIYGGGRNRELQYSYACSFETQIR